jgi:alcohol dehydrogenase
VFEVAGGNNTFEMGWQLARRSGIVCVVAMYEECPQALPLRDMYGKNLTFKTGGVHANYGAETLELIEKGRIDTLPLITHRFPLNDALEGYRIFEAQEDHVIKVALTPYRH